MKLLTKQQVAEMLACSTRQVDYLRTEQGLPWLALGGCVRFNQDEVETWLVQNARRSNSPNQQEQETKDNESK